MKYAVDLHSAVITGVIAHQSSIRNKHDEAAEISQNITTFLWATGINALVKRKKK